mmetsp:Transcript_18939/g.39208  ORF Transcript_18939/g.39208 Transcript_18939/m.39208 type:complete len:270 (-) Transcript_18939:166-975(-)
MAKLIIFAALAALVASPVQVQAFLVPQQHSSWAPSRNSLPRSINWLSSSSKSDDSSSDEVSFPLQPGGELVKKSPTIGGSLAEWAPPEVTGFDLADLLDNLDSIRENVLAGELGKRGELYFGLQAALLLCILIGSVPVFGKIIFAVMGPSLLLGGLATCFLTATRLGKSLSPWPVPNDSSILLTDGFYGQVRHPIYSGLLSACFGFSMVTDSVYRLILTGVLFYVLDLKCTFEEKALIEKFGVDYEDYQIKVPGKLFPQGLVEALPWNK